MNTKQAASKQNKALGEAHPLAGLIKRDMFYGAPG